MLYLSTRLLLILAFSLLSLTSFAVVPINWSMSVYDQNNNEVPAAWVAQLIWSSDDAISPPNANNPYLPTQGEIVLHEQPLNVYDWFGILIPDFYEFDDAIAGGYAYVRVFNSAASRYGNSEMTSGPLFISNDPYIANVFNNSLVFITIPVENCPVVGTPCDDNDPCTFDDLEDGNCNCIGTPTACDDGDPCTIDVCDPVLGCIGIPIDNDGDGFTACNGDCDDNNPNIHPNAPELCNGLDNNCDGIIDEFSSANAIGCNNPLACNYTPGAICDDGSCIDGSTINGNEFYSPNWTTTDQNGNTIDLYSLLEDGQTVVLDLFTFWCPPSQAMLTTGFLSDWNNHLGPNGLDAIRMISIEIENASAGNLVPFVNLADWPVTSDFGSDIANIYGDLGVFQNAVPTILLICPDRSVTEVFPYGNQLPADDFFNYNPQMGLQLLNNVCGCRGIPCTTNIGCVDSAGCNYDPLATCPGPCTSATTWYQDLDDDGIGNTNVTLLACEQPAGYVSIGFDCDDTNNAITDEIGCGTCTGIETAWLNDNQYEYEQAVLGAWSQCIFSSPSEIEACFLSIMEQLEASGEIPVGETCNQCAYEFANCILSECLAECVGGTQLCYDCIQLSSCRQTFAACAGLPDSDGDGWADGSDCDPNNATISPGAIEVCDGLDNNCNGIVDDGVAIVQFQDLDGDGYGDYEFTVIACEALVGYSQTGGDCNDFDSDIYPGAEDICGDGIDSNCDGDDCDVQDSDGDSLPDFIELDWGTDPFNIDSDFDGLTDNFEFIDLFSPADSDFDGLIDALDDDDDNDGIMTFDELNDAVIYGDIYDADFDGLYNWQDTNSDGDAVSDSDEYGLDLDLDGLPDYLDNDSPGVVMDNDNDGFTAAQGDCDDTDASVYPGALEICDTIDNDCDGIVDELCGDSDGDGLIDFDELNIGTDMFVYDTDGDGLSDGDEYLNLGTNPLLSDMDHDGLSDGAEVNTTGTSPFIQDTDGDGCNDLLQYGGQCPNQPVACMGDLNGDGVVNAGDLLAFLSAFGTNCL
ncbi:MAG: hypothetical protein GC193_09540 [Cryomorphaceae bacterium]|nr:hypothetical protein [Cryomorphaceae bacterium]